jgi:hypothetical protein
MISARGNFLLGGRARRGSRRRTTIGSTVVAAAAAAVLVRRSHHGAAAAFTMHQSFSDLIPLYDAFILDQFGETRQ